MKLNQNLIDMKKSWCYDNLQEKLFESNPERRNIMFDMQKIGKKISELRKRKNITQMELADQMGISFQAVSNWERGNSMPDISKLPSLAEFLGVSLDELLGERSVLVEAAVNNNIEEVIKNQVTSAEEVSALLPILKPKQVNTIIESIEKIDYKLIQSFLPFMNEDDVKEFALKVLKMSVTQ